MENPQPEDKLPPALPWYDVWTYALTSPTERTYRALLAEPGASPYKGVVLLFICTLIGYAIGMFMRTMLGQSIFDIFDQAIAESGLNLPASFGRQIGMTYLICVIPLSAISSVIGLYINSFFIKLIGGVLGGKASLNDIVYLNTTFMAPVSLLYGILIGIPYLNLIGSLLIGFYTLFLQLLATKTAHRFSWGRSIATYVILIMVVATFCCACYGAFFFLAMSTGGLVTR